MLGDALFEVELDAIARGVRHEELNLGAAGHRRATVSNSKVTEPILEGRQVPASKRDVVKGPGLRADLPWCGRVINEMKNCLVSDVEPVAMKGEWRSFANAQADHIHVERAEFLQKGPLGTQVEVIEGGDWHQILRGTCER
jgi:hypothetical protein